MTSGGSSQLTQLPVFAVEARIHLTVPEGAVNGAFSFADAPRLSRALRAGDEAAFEFLHGHWNHRLFRYALALAAGDGQFAAEITQATYLRAFRHLRELPDETALWNWLARAARSAASDSRRVRGRYHGALARFAAWLPFGRHAEPELPEAGDEHSLLVALEAAIARLDEPDRVLLEGRYFRQDSLPALAARAGISTRAVEGRLARLRTRLRDLIQTELKRTEPMT